MTILRRRLMSAAGLASPIGYLAFAIALGMVVLALGAVVLDRERSQQRAAGTAEAVADIARRRMIDVLSRTDATLRAVADAAGGPSAQIEALIAARRQAEPRLLAVYLLGADNVVLAGSAGGTARSASLVPACLGKDQPEAEQVFLRAIAVEPTAGTALRGLCVTHGFRRDGRAGAVMAVMAADLIGAQFADLSVGRHGAVVLLDESTRPLALVAPGGAVVLNPAEPPAPLAGWTDLSGGKVAIAQPGNGIVEARSIERPFGAILAVVMPAEDVLAEWWSRSLFVGSSSALVILFLVLATTAVMRCERRERQRLELLGTLTLDLESGSDAAALSRHVAEAACALTGCREVAGEPTEAMRPPTLTLPGARFVRMGTQVLASPDTGGFSAQDLTLLTILSRIGTVHAHTADRLGEADATLAAQEARAENYRGEVEVLLLEMSDAMLTLDHHWHITGTNRNADRLFGEYAEDVRGRLLWDVFPELVGGPFEAECRRVAARRLPGEFELKWLRTETVLMVNVHPRPSGVAVYLQDISRQVATDDPLRDGAKMEAIGRLTGGIAHDFNNLLTVILGNIEMLDFELPESGEVREMHEQIRKAALSAAERTHQMLAFARRQPLAPREVDVGRLVTGLDGLLRRAMGVESTLEIVAPASLWTVRVDPTQLENAIVSLAQNARDAIPAGRGGRLLVECANIAIRKPEIDRFGELRPGNYVVISLSDNGVGIPRDVLGKVFEPFFTTKSGGQGTGLGLAMVYGFVMQSGGHVRLVSEEGRGATVRLYLPAAGEVAKRGSDPSAGRGQNQATMHTTGERILVVEDSEMVRSYAHNVLVSLGYGVTSVSDGADAVARIEAGERPNLLLTDVLLANGMDGVRVAAEVVRRLPGLPVIYMSGYVENIDIGQLDLDPQRNLLLKPFRRTALARMVRERLDSV